MICFFQSENKVYDDRTKVRLLRGLFLNVVSPILSLYLFPCFTLSLDDLSMVFLLLSSH